MLPTVVPKAQRAPPPPPAKPVDPAPGLSTAQMLQAPAPHPPMQATTGAEGAAAPDVEEAYAPPPEEPFLKFTAGLVPSTRSVGNSSIPLGLAFSPVDPQAPTPPLLRRHPVRCTTCGAFANRYCQVDVDTGHWRCVFCSEDNQTGAREYASQGGAAQSLELSEAAVDWQPLTHLAPGSFGEPTAPQPPPVLYAVDETLDEAEMADLRKSLLGAIGALPPNTPVGLLTYSSSVAVYDLSQAGAATADVIAGTKPPTAAALRAVLYGSGAHLAPVHVCLPILQSIIGALRPLPARGVPGTERERCLGPALQVAVAVVRGASARGVAGQSTTTPGGRIIVCAGGHPSLGPGAWPADEEHPQRAFLMNMAQDYLRALAAQANSANVHIDVLAGSRTPVGAVLIEPLVEKTGGALILHEGFGAHYMHDLASAPSRVVGLQGVVDLRVSESLAVAQIIGPVEELTAGTANMHDMTDVKGLLIGQDHRAGAGALDWSPNAVALRTLESQHAVWAALRLVEDVPSRYVYFQAVATFVPVGAPAESGPVTRVVTVRRAVAAAAAAEAEAAAGPPRAYLRSVDCALAAQLLAKQTVLRLLRADPTDPKAAMAALRAQTSQVMMQLLDIARQFGPEPDQRQIRALPAELRDLGEGVYGLVRGAMVAGILGHLDERRALHAAFVKASAAGAAVTMLPTLWVHRGGDHFDRLPPVSLAMQSQYLLLLDHGADIFIWIGNELGQDRVREAEALEAATHFAQELSKPRFPHPVIRTFREGSSMARYLAARLEPLHKEAPEMQLARFPALGLMSPDERKALESKFLFTDDPCFSEWMYAIPLLPNPPDAFNRFMAQTELAAATATAAAAATSAPPTAAPPTA